MDMRKVINKGNMSIKVMAFICMNEHTSILRLQVFFLQSRRSRLLLLRHSKNYTVKNIKETAKAKLRRF